MMYTISRMQLVLSIPPLGSNPVQKEKRPHPISMTSLWALKLKSREARHISLLFEFVVSTWQMKCKKGEGGEREGHVIGISQITIRPSHRETRMGIFWVPHYAFFVRVPCSAFLGCGLQVSGCGFRVLSFGFWVQGFGFRVLSFGFWVLGFGF